MEINNAQQIRDDRYLQFTQIRYSLQNYVYFKCSYSQDNVGTPGRLGVPARYLRYLASLDLRLIYGLYQCTRKLPLESV